MRHLITPSIALRRVGRFRQVVGVLVKYGFGEVLTRIHIWEAINFERRILRREPKLPELTSPQRLRLVLEELGPTFIKLGQILSTRPDRLPPAYLAELARLQDQVPPMPLDICGADSQGGIGYMIQQTVQNLLREGGVDQQVATLVTQVVVDRGDAGFRNPTKPIGPFYPEQKARELERTKGWKMMASSR